MHCVRLTDSDWFLLLNNYKLTTVQGSIYFTVDPACGRGTPFRLYSFLVHSLPHRLLFYFFPFPFVIYLFSSFVHPFPFNQNSPTPFPGWRS